MVGFKGSCWQHLTDDATDADATAFLPRRFWHLQVPHSSFGMGGDWEKMDDTDQMLGGTKSRNGTSGGRIIGGVDGRWVIWRMQGFGGETCVVVFGWLWLEMGWFWWQFFFCSTFFCCFWVGWGWVSIEFVSSFKWAPFFLGRFQEEAVTPGCREASPPGSSWVVICKAI